MNARVTTTARGLRAVALFEAAKGLLALAVGASGAAMFALVRLGGSGGARSAGAFARWVPPAVERLVGLMARWHPAWLLGGIVAYAGLRFLEAYGLWRSRVWAEWVGVVSGAIYLPFEVWQIWKHFSWLLLGAIAINLVIVGYLANALRDPARRPA